jgi:rod shape-determining protein MreC
MQNIIRLIQNNSNLLLFLLIQIISFALIFNWRNTLHHSAFLSSSNHLLGSALEVNSNVSNYFKLAEINKGLVEENEALKSKIHNQEIILSNDFVFLNDTIFKRQYKFLYANVISSQFKSRENFIILNQGNKSGVKQNMGVIGNYGLLGVVVSVGKYYSSVLPVINSSFELAVRHQQTKSFGILKWSKNDNWQTATIEDVPSYVNIKIGDVIETSGASGIFPSGILVGKVIKVNQIEATQFFRIKISLAEDYASIYNAYVVKNENLKELQVIKNVGND